MIKELYDSGKYEEIIDIFSNEKPVTQSDYLLYALSYYNLNKKNKAIGVLKEMLKKFPGNPDALFNLSIIYYQLKNWNKVKEYAEQYFRLDENSWEINDILSDLYVFEGNFEKALKHMGLALKNVPEKLLVELKNKFYLLKERIQTATQKPKLAIVCIVGGDKFINDIIEGLSNDYWVRKFIVKTDREIYKAIDWADIVWFEWADQVAIVGTNYPGIIGKKIIVRLHSYEVFSELPRRINWSNVDKLIFVAPHIKEIFFREFSDVAGRVATEVVFNGVDLNKLTFKERKPGYNIAWVADISYKKNPPMMLQIIKKLKEINSNYKLHVAGSFQDKRYEYYLKYMVKEMGLEDNVIFYGWVDDMDEWWEDKNYLLSTSIHESFGYNIAEAMSKGIKPIIHNFYGVKELYPDKYIYDTVDEAVKMITSDEYNSKEYREFIERFSLEKQIENIKQILKNMVDKDGLLLTKTKNDGSFINLRNNDANISQVEDNVSCWKKLWSNYLRTDPVKIANEIFGVTLRSEFAELLSRFFYIKDAKILEVGTGTGLTSLELSLWGAKVTGIDIEEESIKLAKMIAERYDIHDCNFKLGNGFELTKQGFKDYDIVFNVGVLEHFDDTHIIKMLKEMAESGKYIIIGVPYSGSAVYKLAKDYSQKKNTWEYGVERDFFTFKQLFKEAGIIPLYEEVIGVISEAGYVRRINPEATNIAIAHNLKKYFEGYSPVGSWLISIGTKDQKYARLFEDVNDNRKIRFQEGKVIIKEVKFPSVSIIIPFYNGKNYISQALENISHIKYPDFEVVFVNDGSEDGSDELLKDGLKKYKALRDKVVIHNLEKNIGTFRARYEGVKACNGEYIFFHDIDDVIFTRSLEKLALHKANIGDDYYIAVSCALKRGSDFTGEVWYRQFLPDLMDYVLLELNLLSGRISLINTLLNKKLLKEVYQKLMALFDDIGIEKMKVAEDTIIVDEFLLGKMVKRIIPVFYTYLGYEIGNSFSMSKQIEQRAKDIPIQCAYVLVNLKKKEIFGENELNELENKILSRAMQIYGESLFKVFHNNFKYYKSMFTAKL
ncbi:putative glycosyltransferase EpsJ [Fervidicola ferrireducens]|uniref:Putative glycosyltransferase EpsJ n=1 Tax=Fervidicola ferrireducens TaxID=520764 RepID=A0A140LE29_9FIRM|nr:glycosyltransferase [Fervidicola ferrireducens]KXG78804.1 putative glycosyltransferase EpsJ [Fervidicola ferrireducens]